MTVGEYALVRPLASLLDDEPEIRIDLTVANTDVLLEKLRAGEIDFAVIEGYFHKDIFGYEVFSTENTYRYVQPDTVSLLRQAV